jgi:hypothetical protein
VWFTVWTCCVIVCSWECSYRASSGGESVTVVSMPAFGDTPLGWLPSVLVLFFPHGEDLFQYIVVKA